MAIVRQTLLLACATAGLWIAPSPQAHADAFAQALLQIDNFRLLHSSGTPFSAEEFQLMDGSNSASAGAWLDGRNASSGRVDRNVRSWSSPDGSHQFIGLPATPSVPAPDNDFSPLPAPFAVPGTFGYADYAFSGSAIDGLGGPAGVHASTRAVASLARPGNASAGADLGTSTTFQFMLGAGDTISLAFDGTPYTQAYADAANGDGSAAFARVSWSVNILNLRTGELVFAYQPGELNSYGNVGRSDSVAGMSVYSPGTLSFWADTPYLDSSDSYQLTVYHSTVANALQRQVALPEPDSLALFGLALMALAAFTNRRGRASAARRRQDAMARDGQDS